MVEGAQLSKAPIQALGDRVSAYFVPTVALASLVVFVVWYSCGMAWALQRLTGLGLAHQTW
jgi:cation transport ATPase